MHRTLRKYCTCPRARWAKCPHAFYFRKQYRGRRIHLSLDEWLGHQEVRSVADAEQTVLLVMAELRAGSFSMDGPSRAPITEKTPARATVAEVVSLHYQTEQANPLRTRRYLNSLRYYGQSLIRCDVPDVGTLGLLSMGAMTTAHLEVFYDRLVHQQLSASVRNKFLHYLRSFSRWAKHKGCLESSWLADPEETRLRRRKERRRHRRLQLEVRDEKTGRIIIPDEEDRLLAAANPLLRDLIIAALESGVRIGELLELRWRHVDLARRQMTIEDCKDPDDVQTRLVPLSDRLLPVLQSRQRCTIDEARFPPSAFVFGTPIGERIGSILTGWENAVLTAHGHRVERDKRTKNLSAACRAAYASIDLVFHDLRHEAASRWLEAGWRLDLIQAMLGHKSLSTTEIYLNIRSTETAVQMAAYDRNRAELSGKSGQKVARSLPGTGRVSDHLASQKPVKLLEE
jgi:integrase